MGKKPKSSTEGLAEYKAFLEKVASEGLGYAITNYFDESDHEAISKYDKELANSLEALRAHFTAVEDRVFTDMTNWNIEY